MIEACSLSSGSNGNVFYIRAGKDSFLVDTGISCKQICIRLKEIGSDIEEINGIFITHEHTDHIRGLPVLSNKYSIPVYMTEKTYLRSHVVINQQNLRFIKAKDFVEIGNTVIQSLPKSHDAIEPVLFRFHYGNKKVSIITDAGYSCRNITTSVEDTEILFLEFNYDEEMLLNGFYSDDLKRRVAGKRGHLSNVMAAQTISEHASTKLEYVFLSHLSENNNTPQSAMDAFLMSLSTRKDLSHLENQSFIAHRDSISKVVRIKTET